MNLCVINYYIKIKYKNNMVGIRQLIENIHIKVIIIILYKSKIRFYVFLALIPEIFTCYLFVSIILFCVYMFAIN